MKTLSAGSAKRQSNASTSTPATIAAMEPRPSPMMCRKAARTLRLERDDRSSSAPAITLAVSPPEATSETMPPRTSGGAPSRCAASVMIDTATMSSAAPLTSAAITSARMNPKLRRAVSGLVASHAAPHASPSARMSSAVCAASASSARLPLTRAPTTSTPRYPSSMPPAMPSAFRDDPCSCATGALLPT